MRTVRRAPSSPSSAFAWLRHPATALVGALLLALALRLALWMQPLHQLANDEVEYVTVARDLLAGRGWQFYEHYHWLRAPLYPLFLAGSLWLSRGDVHWAALPNMLLSVSTVALAYAFTHELVAQARPAQRRWCSWCAALGTALLCTLATFASLYMAETLFTALLTAALWLLVRWERVGGWRTLALAGILFGLATLTRSITLAFVPIVLLWIVTKRTDGRWGIGDRGQRRATSERPEGLPQRLRTRYTQGIISACVFGACVLLPIAPWTLRNCAAYGSCILVETGLSYNLWAFNEPRVSEVTIFHTLENIPNPATRAAYATAQGEARLREDPAILLRKLWPNWSYLWRVNPIIEDRFILPTYYADPPPFVFLAALVLDDALYACIVIAGVLGLARLGRPRIQLLCAAWLAYIVVVTLLTHAEGRYRHFLFPILIPCAAWMVTRWSERQQAAGSRQEMERRKDAEKVGGGRQEVGGARRNDEGRAGFRLSSFVLRLITDAVFRPSPFVFRLATGLLVTLLVYSVATNYPWAWAWGGAQRSVLEIGGDFAWWRGDLAGAQVAYRRAVRAQATPDVWLRLGDAQRAAGDDASALDSYDSADQLAPAYAATAVRRGDLLRQLGRNDDARRAFAISYTLPQTITDWAWNVLQPAPVTRIDVGDGLDFGYLSGVYAPEEQQGAMARWSDGRALLRLAIGAQPTRILLRLAAPRPDGGVVKAEVCLAQRCTTLTLQPTWRTYTVILPPTPDNLPVRITSDTFVASDGRHLGVLLDWVAVGE